MSERRKRRVRKNTTSKGPQPNRLAPYPTNNPSHNPFTHACSNSFTPKARLFSRARNRIAYSSSGESDSAACRASGNEREGDDTSPSSNLDEADVVYRKPVRESGESDRGVMMSSSGPPDACATGIKPAAW